MTLTTLAPDDHFFDTFTSRTCHGHPLPCNSTGACVSEADAAKVVAIGDWEYECVFYCSLTVSGAVVFAGCAHLLAQLYLERSRERDGV